MKWDNINGYCNISQFQWWYTVQAINEIVKSEWTSWHLLLRRIDVFHTLPHIDLCASKYICIYTINYNGWSQNILLDFFSNNYKLSNIINSFYKFGKCLDIVFQTAITRKDIWRVWKDLSLSLFSEHSSLWFQTPNS